VAHQQHATVPRRFRFRQGHVRAVLLLHHRPDHHRRYGQRHAEAQHDHVLHDYRADLRTVRTRVITYDAAQRLIFVRVNNRYQRGVPFLRTKSLYSSRGDRNKNANELPIPLPNLVPISRETNYSAQ